MYVAGSNQAFRTASDAVSLQALLPVVVQPVNASGVAAFCLDMMMVASGPPMEEVMATARHLCLGFKVLAVAAMLGAGGAAHADSLRCSDTSIQEGDSKVWLIRACGQPAISDSYCARVVQPVQAQYGHPPYQTVCLMTEEWLYDRGPGNLVAVVRIREGKIISIRYGEQGRSESR